MSGQQQNNTSSSNNNNNRNKRKPYHQGKKSKFQPKRGGPGILLTCETGRERKCQREGLEIINYYYSQQQQEKDDKQEENAATATPKDAKVEGESKETKAASLEDELAQLQSDNKQSQEKQQQQQGDRVHNGPFAVYDTGCRGTVFILNVRPNCSLIPSLNKALAHTDDKNKEANDDNGTDEPDSKKQKLEQPASNKGTEEEEDKEADKAAKELGAWDPRDTVRQVIADLKEEISTKSRKSNIPGSRFVVRMIPIQASCFASLEEITATFRALLELTLSNIGDRKKEGYTFSVVFKKRNCGNVTRDQVIEGVVKQVTEATTGWKVNLNKPDFRVQVEICKTLCGISIVHASQEDSDMAAHNFNLADLRAASAEAQE